MAQSWPEMERRRLALYRLFRHTDSAQSDDGYPEEGGDDSYGKGEHDSHVDDEGDDRAGEDNDVRSMHADFSTDTAKNEPDQNRKEEWRRKWRKKSIKGMKHTAHRCRRE